MKEAAIKKILNSICEDCMVANKKRNKKDIEPFSYQLTIKTSNREYSYGIDEDSNWNVEDAYLVLEDNSGTRWIDTDKIESIEI